MPEQAEEKRSLAEQIVALLRRRILTEELAAGERLPPERQLAQSLGTNRNTLREAVRHLEALGLVETRHGSGATVRSFREDGQLAILPHFLVEAEDPDETLQVLEDVLLLRRVVVAEIVAVTARRAGGAAGPTLRRLLRRIEEAAERGRVREVIELDLELYRSMVRASGSLALIWTFNTFQSLYQAGMEQISSFWSLPDGYLEGLREAVERIAAADPQGAREALLRHLQRSDERALQSVRELLAIDAGGEEE